MAKCLEEWKVLPHKPIEKLEENLWHVVGKLGPIERMMVVARLGDGRLVIFNAVALDEPEMKELEAWGTPAFLVVPSGGHRNDAKIWKQRYPGLTVLCPPGARQKVEQVVPVDKTEIDFGDPSVRMLAPECSGGRDTMLEVRSKRGVTVVFNDLVSNMPHQSGFAGVMFRALGFTGAAPKSPPLIRMLLVKDRAGLRKMIGEYATRGDLVRVVMSHGNTIDSAPADAMKALSTTA
jgi:hypothetical protein